MSHSRYKTKYFEEGAYGETIENTLYVDYNNSCDIVSFYNENFDLILTVQDTVNNNLMEAMIKIWNHNDENPHQDVEHWTIEDQQKKKNKKF